jgi:hypothetical protein
MWINCQAKTYHPHSNECGPQLLCALTLMAIHDSLTSTILLPYMHNNLAQIL